jgi:NADP-dependent 3-hydroxy acid dehydrogenase YdfG
MATHPVATPDSKRAHVVFLGSRSGERPVANLAVYAAAKACVRMWLDAARLEYARHDIAFSYVSPGSVDTRFTEEWSKEDEADHVAVSMHVRNAVEPVLWALNARYAVNSISYESVPQWRTEPGVANE